MKSDFFFSPPPYRHVVLFFFRVFMCFENLLIEEA